MQFAFILEGLAAAPIVLALLAGNKVRAVVAFVAWAARRVARLFNAGSGKA